MARKSTTSHWTIPDGETPHDGKGLTTGSRLAAERAKFERLNGVSLVEAYSGTGLLSQRQLHEIESGKRGIPDRLWPTLITKEFDVQFILTGERILTEAEYAVRDIMRHCDPRDRTTLLAVAQRIPLDITEVHDAYGETVFLQESDGSALGSRAIELVEGPLDPIG